jgi:glycine cleavage system H protein
MATPTDRKYTKEHEWAMLEGDFVVIGITDHAQDSLGDIVFVQLPDEGTEIAPGDPFGEIESVKAVSDLYAPISGKVAKVHDELLDAPETINNDPYGEGWMLKLEPSDPAELDDLMDADQYDEYVESEEG